MSYTLKDDEIAIVLQPIMGEDGILDSIRTGLALGDEAGSDEQTGQTLMDAALAMAAVMQYCQDYPEFEYILDEYKAKLVKEMFPEQYAQAEAEIEAEEGYTSEGNVLTLNAWTKTEGSA